MSRRAVLPALAAALVLTGCAGTAPEATAGESEAPTSPAEDSGRPIEVTVDRGRVSGDTGRVPVAVGERVTLVVTSDAADEVHVHGYDLALPVAVDRPATLDFPADVPGVFEVELHDAGTVLLSLQVG